MGKTILMHGFTERLPGKIEVTLYPEGLAGSCVLNYYPRTQRIYVKSISATGVTKKTIEKIVRKKETRKKIKKYVRDGAFSIFVTY